MVDTLRSDSFGGATARINAYMTIRFYDGRSDRLVGLRIQTVYTFSPPPRLGVEGASTYLRNQSKAI